MDQIKYKIQQCSETQKSVVINIIRLYIPNVNDTETVIDIQTLPQQCVDHIQEYLEERHGVGHGNGTKCPQDIPEQDSTHVISVVKSKPQAKTTDFQKLVKKIIKQAKRPHTQVEQFSDDLMALQDLGETDDHESGPEDVMEEHQYESDSEDVPSISVGDIDEPPSITVREEDTTTVLDIEDDNVTNGAYIFTFSDTPLSERYQAVVGALEHKYKF